jgi:hypothetical protein
VSHRCIARHHRYRFHGGDEDAIAGITKHYDVPLVSMRAALLEPVRRGSPPMLSSLHNFMLDCKHPTGQGHTYLAQMILSRVWAAARDSNGGGGGDGRSGSCSADAPAPVLRPPLLKSGAADASASTCAMGQLLAPLLKREATSGFNFTDEGRNKWGYVGTQPGATVSFCLSTGDAMAQKPGPTANHDPALAAAMERRARRISPTAATVAATRQLAHACFDAEGDPA